MIYEKQNIAKAKYRFKKIKGHKRFLKESIKSILYHKVLRLFIYVYSLLTQKNIMFPCSEKYGIQSAGIRHVFVTCEFGMGFLQIIQVMTETIRFAFHYVLKRYK